MATQTVDLSLAESRNDGAKLRDGFIRLTESLLTAVSQVFPECDEVDMVLRLFRNVVKKDPVKEDLLIRQWYTTMKPHKRDLEAKETETLFTALESIDAIKGIKIREKWTDPEFNDESKESMWQYLYSLNTYSNLYCCVPSRMIGKIEALAGKLCADFQNGSFDISNLDLNELGAGVTSDLTEDELNAFGNNVGEIYESLQSVIGQAGKNGSCEGIDLNAAMNAVSQLLPPGALDGSNPEVANMMASLNSAGTPDMAALSSMLAEMKGKGYGKGKGDIKTKTKRKKRLTDE